MFCRGHANENPELPAALSQKGIRFLGPNAAAMAALGDKVRLLHARCICVALVLLQFLSRYCNCVGLDAVWACKLCLRCSRFAALSVKLLQLCRAGMRCWARNLSMHAMNWLAFACICSSVTLLRVLDIVCLHAPMLIGTPSIQHSGVTCSHGGVLFLGTQTIPASQPHSQHHMLTWRCAVPRDTNHSSITISLPASHAHMAVCCS